MTMSSEIQYQIMVIVLWFQFDKGNFHSILFAILKSFIIQKWYFVFITYDYWTARVRSFILIDGGEHILILGDKT